MSIFYKYFHCQKFPRPLADGKKPHDKKLQILTIIVLLMLSTSGYSDDGFKGLGVETRRSPQGPGVEVVLPSKTASDTITGIELPLRGNNAYEATNIGNFLNGQMVRIITTKTVYLNRLYKAPPATASAGDQKRAVLGQQGTWLTNLSFKNHEQAMSALALLPEWYRRFGLPDTVALIQVPKGTEVYIGNAGPQAGAPPIAPAPQKKGYLNQSQKIKQKREEFGNFAKSNPPPEEVRDFRLGGGVQVLVPPTGLTGHPQLSESNVMGTYRIP